MPFEKIEHFVGGTAAKMAVHQGGDLRLGNTEQRGNLALFELLVFEDGIVGWTCVQRTLRRVCQCRAFRFRMGSMSKLEDLQPNAAVRGILPESLVTVVNAQWFGSEALELTYKTPTGRVANELLYRHDEPRLEVVEQGRPWSFDGDGRLFRLVSEAHRIRLAHLFDPVLAVHT